MRREPTIPLFLWIATAVLTHLAGYGGVDRVATLVERAHELRAFVVAIQRELAVSAQSIEVSLEEQKPPEPAPLATPPDEPKAVAEQEPEPGQEPPKAEPPKPEVKPPAPKPPELAFKPEKAPIAKPEEKKPALELPPVDQRRIAVKQHVEDKNQPDNPNAPFIGDEANQVKEQSQARITSTTQDDKNPSPGTNQSKPQPEPGNGNENRVAQDQDRPGEKRAPEPEPGREPVAASTPAVAPPDGQRQSPAARPSPERPAAPAEPGVQGRPDMVAGGDGSWEAGPGSQAQAPKPRKKRLPPRPPTDPLLGFGSQLLTQNGVNLSLSPRAAVQAIGRDKLARERVADGERRRSTHRGSWKSVGIERWRSAIENYVPSVKLGNQTALNTARVPFASYLNQIHNRIHPIFADQFLDSLDALPAAHPMNANRERMFTSLELVLDRQEGRLVRMGVTKTSGVTAFDVGALESVNRAAPFGSPPEAILSPDGNVYLHWEFHREPASACSTWFARPFILKGSPRSAPPKLEAPPKDERPRERGQLGPAPARRATAARAFDH